MHRYPLSFWSLFWSTTVNPGLFCFWGSIFHVDWVLSKHWPCLMFFFLFQKKKKIDWCRRRKKSHISREVHLSADWRASGAKCRGLEQQYPLLRWFYRQRKVIQLLKFLPLLLKLMNFKYPFVSIFFYFIFTFVFSGFNCTRFFHKVLMTLLGHFKQKLAGKHNAKPQLLILLFCINLACQCVLLEFPIFNKYHYMNSQFASSSCEILWLIWMWTYDYIATTVSY